MKKIGIAGIGGIGSNVAAQLIRSGVMELIYGDFDMVDKSNLNRQFYFWDQIGKSKVESLRENLMKICPTGIYNYQLIKFNKENIPYFFRNCDVIIEGFDSKLHKRTLVDSLLPLGKIIVSASGIGGFSCENVKVRKMTKNFYVVGDFISDVEKEPTYSHKVMMVASLMTEIAMKEGDYFAK